MSCYCIDLLKDLASTHMTTKNYTVSITAWICQWATQKQNTQ